MFLFPRRKAPPEGRARPFLLHQTFLFSKRETKEERKQPYLLSFECTSRAHPRMTAPNPKLPPATTPFNLIFLMLAQRVFSGADAPG